MLKDQRDEATSLNTDNSPSQRQLHFQFAETTKRLGKCLSWIREHTMLRQCLGNRTETGAGDIWVTIDTCSLCTGILARHTQENYVLKYSEGCKPGDWDFLHCIVTVSLKKLFIVSIATRCSHYGSICFNTLHDFEQTESNIHVV